MPFVLFITTTKPALHAMDRGRAGGQGYWEPNMKSCIYNIVPHIVTFRFRNAPRVILPSTTSLIEKETCDGNCGTYFFWCTPKLHVWKHDGPNVSERDDTARLFLVRGVLSYDPEQKLGECAKRSIKDDWKGPCEWQTRCSSPVPSMCLRL